MIYSNDGDGVLPLPPTGMHTCTQSPPPGSLVPLSGLPLKARQQCQDAKMAQPRTLLGPCWQLGQHFAPTAGGSQAHAGSGLDTRPPWREGTSGWERQGGTAFRASM